MTEDDWESHRPAVFGAVYRILGTMAEDVTQEAWLRAADLSQVRDLRAWLVTLAAPDVLQRVEAGARPA